MTPNPVNPLTTPANAVAAEVNLAIAAQVLDLESPEQREYLATVMRDAKRQRDWMRARAATARKQRKAMIHNAKLATRKAAKRNRPARRLTRAQRRRQG